jgi:uncharacterized C2H2 Zn-finger protein
MKKPQFKNLQLIPDEDDSNLYCQTCKKTFVSSMKFRQHLRAVHHMKLKEIESKINTDPDIILNINDPNLHCRACNKFFAQRSTYRAH